MEFAAQVFQLFDFTAKEGDDLSNAKVHACDLELLLRTLGVPESALALAETMINPELQQVLTMEDFLTGLSSIPSLNGSDESVLHAFRLFDTKRKGLITAEEMLIVGCLECEALDAEECKEVVQRLKGTTSVKGLTLGDFRHYVSL